MRSIAAVHFYTPVYGLGHCKSSHCSPGWRATCKQYNTTPTHKTDPWITTSDGTFSIARPFFAINCTIFNNYCAHKSSCICSALPCYFYCAPFSCRRSRKFRPCCRLTQFALLSKKRISIQLWYLSTPNSHKSKYGNSRKCDGSIQ